MWDITIHPLQGPVSLLAYHTSPPPSGNNLPSSCSIHVTEGFPFRVSPQGFKTRFSELHSGIVLMPFRASSQGFWAFPYGLPHYGSARERFPHPCKWCGGFSHTHKWCFVLLPNQCEISHVLSISIVCFDNFDRGSHPTNLNK